LQFTHAAGVTVWLSALFLVKEENVHGDLNEGETVKVRAIDFLARLKTISGIARCL
jgi:hypothetical protein